MRLIDCTLRDGGNLNDWNFSTEDVNHLIPLLDQAGADIIEIGYRGGSGSRNTKDSGIVADCPPDFLRGLPQLARSAYSVMVVPSVCPAERTDDLVDTPVEWVRVASYPANIDSAFRAISHIKSRGLKVGFNLMSASYSSVDSASQICKSAEDCGADMVYIADSFGSLNPTRVAQYISGITSRTSVPVGFHGHNNLGLAFVNAMAACTAGASCIDASLCGMARGAGNLATEQILLALGSWLGSGREIDETSLLDAADYIFDKFMGRPMPVQRREIECGLGDIHYYAYDRIKAAGEEKGIARLDLMRSVGRSCPAKVDDGAIARIIATEFQEESV